MKITDSDEKIFDCLDPDCLWVLEAAGVSPRDVQADVRSIARGDNPEIAARDLLARCLDGADEKARAAWRIYVEDVEHLAGLVRGGTRDGILDEIVSTTSARIVLLYDGSVVWGDMHSGRHDRDLRPELERGEVDTICDRFDWSGAADEDKWLRLTRDLITDAAEYFGDPRTCDHGRPLGETCPGCRTEARADLHDDDLGGDL